MTDTQFTGGSPSSELQGFQSAQTGAAEAAAQADREIALQDLAQAASAAPQVESTPTLRSNVMDITPADSSAGLIPSTVVAPATEAPSVTPVPTVVMPALEGGTGIIKVDNSEAPPMQPYHEKPATSETERSNENNSSQEMYSNAITGLQNLLPDLMSDAPLSPEDQRRQDIYLAIINSMKK